MCYIHACNLKFIPLKKCNKYGVPQCLHSCLGRQITKENVWWMQNYFRSVCEVSVDGGHMSPLLFQWPSGFWIELDYKVWGMLVKWVETTSSGSQVVVHPSYCVSQD